MTASECVDQVRGTMQKRLRRGQIKRTAVSVLLWLVTFAFVAWLIWFH